MSWTGDYFQDVQDFGKAEADRRLAERNARQRFDVILREKRSGRVHGPFILTAPTREAAIKLAIERTGLRISNCRPSVIHLQSE